MKPATIRPAVREDEQRLREIAFAAKANWGYEHERVRTWVNTLRLFGNAAPRAEIHVAERAAQPIAWMRVIPCGAFCVLEDLWVEPAWQRAGVGSTLFWLAQRRAHDLGAQRLEWKAEPNAIGFYTRMGARHIRDTPPNEWDRVLQVMAVDLVKEDAQGAPIAPVNDASGPSRRAAVADDG